MHLEEEGRPPAESDGRAVWGDACSKDAKGYSPNAIMLGELFFRVAVDNCKYLGDDDDADTLAAEVAAAEEKGLELNTGVLAAATYEFMYSTVVRADETLSPQDVIIEILGEHKGIKERLLAGNMLHCLSMVTKQVTNKFVTLSTSAIILNSKLECRELDRCPNSGRRILNPTAEQLRGNYELVQNLLAQLLVVTGKAKDAAFLFPALESEINRVLGTHVTEVPTPLTGGTGQASAAAGANTRAAFTSLHRTGSPPAVVWPGWKDENESVRYSLQRARSYIFAVRCGV